MFYYEYHAPEVNDIHLSKHQKLSRRWNSHAACKNLMSAQDMNILHRVSYYFQHADNHLCVHIYMLKGHGKTKLARPHVVPNILY